jgi:hypothetical protein
VALLHYNRAFELNRIDLENFVEKIDFDLSWRILSENKINPNICSNKEYLIK